MRSNLVNGKLIPPGSPVAAQVRHQQLVYEIGKLEKSFESASLPIERLLAGSFDRRDAAIGCLGWLREEEKQLSAWMQAHDVQAIAPKATLAAAEKTEEDFAAFWRE